MRRLLALSTLLAAASTASAQQPYENPKYPQADKFRQLDELLPTPNVYRTASGAPGPEYWQQQADYVIEVELDDVNQRLTGYETITYTNNSPDTLNYLWVQLDQNRFRPDSDDMLTRTTGGLDRLSFSQLDSMLYRMGFEGGYDISEVSYANGRPLKHTIVRTMMRVEPDKALEPGDTFSFNIGWSNNIIDADRVRSRGGYEYFPEDDNYIYEIAQWFPRMAAYTDYAGWQHKQFLGNGEFTLEFGDYDVSITAPDDHVVASTGVLQNPRDVMTREQRQRFERAKNATEPVFIVTPDEAVANQQGAPAGTKTWRFVAEDVRDFAWASSRKFIWDALGHDVNGNETMAMSFYPIEGEPLWSRYSTHTIVHTLNVYSRYSFDYPYPVAISVNGPVGGMEYPMICFNGPRPETDGTYTQRTKYGLIGVIIHEVGHFYFPMIVNSDERQWTWMDEGVNTFLQFLTEQEWEDNYPSRRGEPQDITGYMASQRQVPIMTNSESIQQFGANAYAKPATALNILRESVMGREAFDYAFKTYAERWKFKRPEPADLFRTMEDASGIDLDWFWRGWFYTTDHVDIAVTNVREYRVDTQNPLIEDALAREVRDAEPTTVSEQRYADARKYTDAFPELLDFYNSYDPLETTPAEMRRYERTLASLSEDRKALLELEENFYVFDFENVGGLVMPIILHLHYTDGTKEDIRMPAEVWRRNVEQVSTMHMTPKVLDRVVLDPYLETADTDLSNNHFPPRPERSRFELFEFNRQRPNPMREAIQEQERQSQGGRMGGEDDE